MSGMSSKGVNYKLSSISGVIQSGNLASDPMSDSQTGKQTFLSGTGAVIQVGVVVRSGVGTYDCDVLVGSREIACQIVSPMISPTYGYSISAIPPEGTLVIIALPSINDTTGYVLGCVPLGVLVTPPESDGEYESPVEFPNAPAGYGTWAAFSGPPEDPDFFSKIQSANNRPADILSGEFCFLNDNNCGFVGTATSSNLVGGGSFVKVSRIDDLIRMRSTNYSKWTDPVVENLYNDNAYLSSEKYTFSYQGERYGDKDPLPSSVIITGKEGDKPPVIPHPRMKEFSGYFGGVYTKLVERPEKKKLTDSDKGSSSKDEAVLMSHIGEDGNSMCRSAGGVRIERYDKIPSVRRIRKPWDPEGDEPKPESVSSFNFNKNEGFRPLELYDSIAWSQKEAYHRFDTSKKEFVVQEETSIDVPKDENGNPEKSKSNMSDNKGRRCGVYLEQNGSIVIRDAWGSEIVMSGGNIYFNASNSVVSTANKDVVSYAGRNFVSKAREISETESLKYTIVRGVKLVNVQGGCDDSSGGILLESFGQYDTNTLSKKGKGLDDETEIGGIILKSGSGVSVNSKVLRATVKEEIDVGCGSDEKRDGKIVLSGGEVDLVGDDQVHLGVETAGMTLYDKTIAMTSAGDLITTTKGSIFLVQDTDKALVGIWNPIDSSPYKTNIGIVKDLYTSFDPKTILESWTHKDYEKEICSQLGTSEQYGTNKGFDFFETSHFLMYSPYWHTMKNDGSKLIKNSPSSWDESKNQCYGNCAWPGKSSIDSGKVAVLDSSKNMSGGYSKNRKNLASSSGVTEKSFKSDFKV